jgi:hypothetical protein
MSYRNRFLVGIAFAVMLSGNLTAQSIYGILTGIISDPSQAVVANAALTLRDESSGSPSSARFNSSRSASGRRPSQQLPYPSPVQGKNKSDSLTASLTHVFDTSITNEFAFG